MFGQGSLISGSCRFLSMLIAVVLLGPDFSASKMENKTHERDGQWVELPVGRVANCQQSPPTLGRRPRNQVPGCQAWRPWACQSLSAPESLGASAAHNTPLVHASPSICVTVPAHTGHAHCDLSRPTFLSFWSCLLRISVPLSTYQSAFGVSALWIKLLWTFIYVSFEGQMADYFW